MKYFLVTITLLVLPSTYLSADDKLLEFVTSAHQSSRCLIRASYCRVKLDVEVRSAKTPSTTEKQSCEAEHWNSVEESRLNVLEFGKSSESDWKDLVRTGLFKSDSDSPTRLVAAGRGALPRHTHRVDSWIRGLLVLSVPNTVQWYTFEDLLGKATKVVSVDRRKLEGTETVVVRLRFNTKDVSTKWEDEIYLDTAVNHLIRKIVRFADDKQYAQEEVVAFKNFGGGVFFPEHIIGGSGDAGDALRPFKERNILN